MALTEDQTLPAFADWLFARSGGQPFYLKEMIQMLSEQALLARKDVDGRFSIDFAGFWYTLVELHRQLNSTARRTLAYIIEQIDDRELRASLTALADVKRLLD